MVKNSHCQVFSIFIFYLFRGSRRSTFPLDSSFHLFIFFVSIFKRNLFLFCCRFFFFRFLFYTLHLKSIYTMLWTSKNDFSFFLASLYKYLPIVRKLIGKGKGGGWSWKGKKKGKIRYGNIRRKARVFFQTLQAQSP